MKNKGKQKVVLSGDKLLITNKITASIVGDEVTTIDISKLPL